MQVRKPSRPSSRLADSAETWRYHGATPRTETNVRCPVCRGVQAAAASGRSPWAKCRACGAQFRRPMPSPELLQAYYVREFEAAGYRGTSMHATNVSAARQYISQAERSLGGFQWAKSRILDYGAGEGDLSQLLEQLGARVTAIESFGQAVCRARGDRDIPST